MAEKPVSFEISLGNAGNEIDGELNSGQGGGKGATENLLIDDESK